MGDFKGLTLDCETYLDADLIQHLMSIATFDGKNPNFYFLTDYKSDLELIENVLIDILSYNDINVYIHNGAKFDLIFLITKIVELKDKLKLAINVVYKDGEFIDIKICSLCTF